MQIGFNTYKYIIINNIHTKNKHLQKYYKEYKNLTNVILKEGT